MLRQGAYDLMELAAAQEVDRAAVSEVRVESVQPLPRAGSPEDPLRFGEHELERHARQATPGIRDDGRTKVLAGTTSLEELLRVTREE